jgi:hypothetical protein
MKYILKQPLYKLNLMDHYETSKQICLDKLIYKYLKEGNISKLRLLLKHTDIQYGINHKGSVFSYASFFFMKTRKIPVISLKYLLDLNVDFNQYIYKAFHSYCNPSQIRLFLKYCLPIYYGSRGMAMSKNVAKLFLTFGLIIRSLFVVPETYQPEI